MASKFEAPKLRNLLPSGATVVFLRLGAFPLSSHNLERNSLIVFSPQYRSYQRTWVHRSYFDSSSSDSCHHVGSRHHRSRKDWFRKDDRFLASDVPSHQGSEAAQVDGWSDRNDYDSDEGACDPDSQGVQTFLESVGSQGAFHPLASLGPQADFFSFAIFPLGIVCVWRNSPQGQHRRNETRVRDHRLHPRSND